MDVYKSLTRKTAISLEWTFMEKAAIELRRSPEGSAFLDGLVYYTPMFIDDHANYPLFEHLIVFLYLRYFVPVEFGHKWSALGSAGLSKAHRTSFGEAIDVILFNKMLPEHPDVPHQLSFLDLCYDEAYGFKDDRILLQRMWFIRAHVLLKDLEDGLPGLNGICWYDHRLTLVIYAWARHNRRYHGCPNERCDCIQLVKRYGIRPKEFSRIYQALEKLVLPTLAYIRSNESAGELPEGAKSLSRAVEADLYKRFGKKWPSWFTTYLANPENRRKKPNTEDSKASTPSTKGPVEGSNARNPILRLSGPDNSLQKTSTASLTNPPVVPPVSLGTTSSVNSSTPPVLSHALSILEQASRAKGKNKPKTITSRSTATTSKTASEAGDLNSTRSNSTALSAAVVKGGTTMQARPYRFGQPEQSNNQSPALTNLDVGKPSSSTRPEDLVNPAVSSASLIHVPIAPPNLQPAPAHQHRAAPTLLGKRTREDNSPKMSPVNDKETIHVVRPGHLSLPPAKRFKVDIDASGLAQITVNPVKKASPLQGTSAAATNLNQNLGTSDGMKQSKSIEDPEKSALASVVTALKRIIELTDEDAVSTAGTSTTTSSKSKSSSNRSQANVSPGGRSSSGKKILLGVLDKNRKTNRVLHQKPPDSASSSRSEPTRFPNPPSPSSRSSITTRDPAPTKTTPPAKTVSLPVALMGTFQTIHPTESRFLDFDENDRTVWHEIRAVPPPPIHVYCTRKQTQLLSPAHEARRLMCLLVGIGLPLEWASVDISGHGIIIHSTAVTSLLSVIREDTFESLRSAGVRISLKAPSQDSPKGAFGRSKLIPLETLSGHESLISVTDNRPDRQLRDHLSEHIRLGALVHSFVGSHDYITQPTTIKSPPQRGEGACLTLDKKNSDETDDMVIWNFHQLGLQVYRGQTLLPQSLTEAIPAIPEEVSPPATPTFDWRAVRAEVLKMKLPWETDGDDGYTPSPYERWSRGMPSSRWSAASNLFSTMATAGLRWNTASFPDSEDDGDDDRSTGGS